MGTALYPGSFDPIHNGHVSVVETLAAVFDSVVVAVAENSRKVGYVPVVDRVKLIEQSLSHLSNIKVATYKGLTIEAATEYGAVCVAKGVRNSSDFNNEMTQAAMNSSSGAVKTLFVPGLGAHGLVSSSFVREVSAYGGDVSASVPPPVVEYLNSSSPSKQV